MYGRLIGTAVLLGIAALFAGIASAQEAAVAALSEAARKEGSVVVYGPPGESSRRAFSEAFEKAYPGVKVSYEGAFGPAHLTKIMAGHSAQRYIADIFINGPEPALALKRANLLQEIESVIVQSGIKDADKWWLSKLDFIDRERKYVLAFWAYPAEPFYYNSDLLKEADIRSWKDLLDPRYRGKIGIYDPTIAGSTLPKLNHFLHDKSLGEGYVRALLAADNKVFVTRDDRQLAEAVARGTYWIGIGGTWQTAAAISKAMPALKIFPAERLAEGTMFTSGFGNIGLLINPPHPNAAKLYVNWLLSRDGQAAITTASGQQSGRNDVPVDSVPVPIRRDAKVKGFVEYYEDLVAGRAKASELAKQLLGR